MESAYADIVQLTAGQDNLELAQKAAMRFAWNYGWRPSFFLPTNPANRDEIASAHLVIEQGLENTAVITFLARRKYDSLEASQINKLLEISYNNLIDWHIVIDDTKVTYLNNRARKNRVKSAYFDQGNLEALRYKRFLKISDDYYDVEIEKLDEKLLSVIAQHRRMLYSTLKEKASVEALSNFFNGIIFCRALEDQRIAEGVKVEYNLIDYWIRFKGNGGIFREFFSDFAAKIYGDVLPNYILHREDLDIFDELDETTVFNILKDFYGNSLYNYDFSLMNKHALGKIYEKYVTQLSIPFQSQPTLFEMSVPAEEQAAHLTGTVYTPQYIASFFTKYAVRELGQENIFQGKHIDPACGSGIFLRNLVEKVTLSLGKVPVNNSIEKLFANIYAVDINRNATYSSVLSLSLLHLSLTGKFPKDLNVIHTDSLGFLGKSEQGRGFYSIFSNPPYINSDDLIGIQKENAQKAMGDFQMGKFDTYLAFLVASINSLADGGIGFFVIPHRWIQVASAQRDPRVRWPLSRRAICATTESRFRYVTSSKPCTRLVTPTPPSLSNSALTAALSAVN